MATRPGSPTPSPGRGLGDGSGPLLEQRVWSPLEGASAAGGRPQYSCLHGLPPGAVGSLLFSFSREQPYFFPAGSVPASHALQGRGCCLLVGLEGQAGGECGLCQVASGGTCGKTPISVPSLSLQLTRGLPLKSGALLFSIGLGSLVYRVRISSIPTRTFLSHPRWSHCSS